MSGFFITSEFAEEDQTCFVCEGLGQPSARIPAGDDCFAVVAGTVTRHACVDCCAQLREEIANLPLGVAEPN